MRLIAYHDALYREGTAASSEQWDNVEEVAERLAAYYVPIICEQPHAGFVSKDALMRSQLGETIRRCRMHRQS